MDSFSGDNEESAEEITKRKSSKIKSLKTRFFRRGKKTGSEADAKLSQSASDITARKVLGSDEDLASQGTMGSRAFSHDSIFLADEGLSDPDPVRLSSQENVHSKIKSLQMKLQLQKMHFGPPPMVLPIRSPEETAHKSEHLSFQSCNETLEEENFTKTKSQPTSPPVSPVSRFAQTRFHPPIQFSYSAPNYCSTTAAEAPVDFSAPAKFTASLDTSAARHRMSIKPRNQRATSKRKPPSGIQSGSLLHDLKTTDYFELVQEQEQEQEQEVVVQPEETKEKEQVDPFQLSPIEFEDVPPILSEVVPKLPSPTVSLQDKALPETEAPPVLRVKPSRLLDVLNSKRPHSSYIESEIKEKIVKDLESKVMPQNKRHTFITSVTELSSDQSSPFSSLFETRASPAQQQHLQKEEDASTRLKRPSPGSGSLYLPRNREGERPRTGSFTGVLEKPEAKAKTTEETEEKITREKEEVKILHPIGDPCAAERTDSSPPWERYFSFKKKEPGTPVRNATLDTSLMEAVRVESTQELVDEAEEAKELPESEIKTPFGVKLRSTSNSFKHRSETASQRHSATFLSDDQDDTKKTSNICESSNQMSEKLHANISCSLKSSDQAAFSVTLPARHNTSFEESPQTTPTEVQPTSSNQRETEPAPLEPRPSPQTSSPETSWISLAMQKTRSFQHLFTSRFQRDFTAAPTTVCPKNQEETTPHMQSQAVKIQQNTTQLPLDPMKDESVQSGCQEQAAKPLTRGGSKKLTLISQFESYSSKDSSMCPQISQGQTQPQSDAQTSPRTTQSPSRSSPQMGLSSPFTRGNAPHSYLSSVQQETSWSNRVLQPVVTQHKPIHSALESEPAVTSAAAPTLDSALERREREGSVLKESPSLVSKRVLWTGSGVDRALFQEKRGDCSMSPLLKELEQRKTQTQMQTLEDSDALATLFPLSKDTGEIRQGAKSAESSPFRVLERPHEDRWTRRNVESPSSPSSMSPFLKELEQRKTQPQMQTSEDSDALATLSPLSKDTGEIRQGTKSAESSPCRVLERPREDRWTRRNVESPSSPSSLRSHSSVPNSDSGQPSWMELAKRKSMAWSDKSMH
ncbi:PREDICTED: uncharacterized protein KIAA1211-like homolog [Cyprinodon variegatus]|uniref:KIAA1211 like n=1 Tax=Cyprinodon variegatus TaxID=28743 RepID=A0A3Q2D9S4_CYPVA|nr:PREDICTED: uncharacterized protein KIAA1211-like homolog [Cyprinodon variegatus]